MSDALPNRPTSVLVVDDEPQMRRLLTVALESAGHRVTTASTGEEGLGLVARNRPDLVLLDLGLPGKSGLEVLGLLREWSTVPVIVVSVQDSGADKIAALDLGADDYVTKPFDTGELLARLRAALRHARTEPDLPAYQHGGLVVDLASRGVTQDGNAVDLTSREYDLLRLLVRHAGKVLTHRHLLREVWGAAAEDQTHYLRVYVARLREKLGTADLIRTESGVGYRMAAGE